MQRALGIDLGTTNSVVAYVHKGEPAIVLNRDNRDLTPSVVGKGRKGELLVGTQAKARAVKFPDTTVSSVKRFMGRKFSDPAVQQALAKVPYKVTEGPDGDVRVWLGERDYTPTEVSAIILRRLKEDAEDRLNQRFTRAVITVPAYFGERQVAATREAGRMAGFHVLRIINEPTAAALAFGLSRDQGDDGKTILVYDLGGGTFDISILMLMQGAFTVLGIEGDNLLGGDDFDESLVRRLLQVAQAESGAEFHTDRDALQAIRKAAEEIKISLSSQHSFDLFLPAIGAKGFDLEAEIQRTEYEALVRGQLNRTIDLTHKAIREANVTPELIDFIVLVGGSTATPLVEQLLREVFGAHKIRKDIDPMQCVAMGAAIQTALLADVECPRCHASTPIQDDDCRQCGNHLYGADMLICSSCYLPSEISEQVCRKCNAKLDTAATSRPTQPAAPASVAADLSSCPKCGKPYSPGSSKCSICDEAAGGLKCQHCGHLNIQGARTCLACGADMSIQDITDVTAKNIGIQLSDGRMAVVLPKSTVFPTHAMISKEFYTSGAGQRRLEVAIYEGDQPVANGNELCGIVSLALPEGLSRGTPVSIAFGLDDNRTVTVEVHIRAANMGVKRTHLQRGQLDPERRRKIEEQRETVTTFMDRWDSELTDRERQAFHEELDHLDQAMNVDPEDRAAPLDDVLEHAARLVALLTEIRGTDAQISNVLISGGKYLRTEQRERLEQFSQDIAQARERADWTAGETLYKQADAYYYNLGTNLLMISRSRTLVRQNKLSPALANRVQGALHNIDEGIDNSTEARVEQGLSALQALEADINQELDNLHLPQSRATGLEDRMA